LSPAADSGDGGREPFALALHGLIHSQFAAPEWSPGELRETYRQLVSKDERLRVSSPEGQTLVAAVWLLSRRSAGQIEGWIRDALAHKGYDAELIELACRRVHAHLLGKPREPPKDNDQ
jgi:hypothetical protein